MLRIGELAERTGVSVRSLRYYEEQGMLLSTRTSGGHRTYDEEAVDRVRLIQILFAAGVTSRNVVEVLPCLYSGTTTPAMLERLRAERDRINTQARQLVATRKRLDAVIVEADKRLVG